ncbi:MAG: CCA tRNA nucleotidyltransferase [Candidatus Woesearchaeota archaeon]
MKFYKYLNEKDNIDWKEHINNNEELKIALEIMKKIDDLGYESLIVGGFVRDILLGIESSDIDIATNMPPEEIENHFNTFDIGKNKQFGVNVITYKGHQFEIAQYRKDIYNSLEGRKGAEEVELVSDFKEDAARRDFTINSLGINYKGEIIDHHGGTNDLKMKKISAVGDPNLRFKEDALRMMRGVRTASKLGFDIEDETKETIKKMSGDITKMSPERIREELVKMAGQTGESFANAIKLLDEVGILEKIMPEITKLKEFKETPEFHPEAYEEGRGTVFDHVISALKTNKLKDPMVNLSILLHDVGKGVTHKKRNGKHTFYNHAEKSKELIDKIAERLKLTNKERKAILFSALNHMKMMHGLEMKPTKILKLVDDENWPILKAVSYCDDACRKNLFDEKRFNDIIHNMEKIYKRWGSKTTNQATKVVDGKRVMKITGLNSGPMVGKIIEKVTDMIVNKGSKESIDSLIKKAYKEIERENR